MVHLAYMRVRNEKESALLNQCGTRGDLPQSQTIECCGPVIWYYPLFSHLENGDIDSDLL